VRGINIRADNIAFGRAAISRGPISGGLCRLRNGEARRTPVTADEH
jgi:hypothetical protein